MKLSTKKRLLCFFGTHNYKEILKIQSSRPALIFDLCGDVVPGVHIYNSIFHKCDFCELVTMEEQYVTYGKTILKDEDK